MKLFLLALLVLFGTVATQQPDDDTSADEDFELEDEDAAEEEETRDVDDEGWLFPYLGGVCVKRWLLLVQ